jgi:hypothetical protein
VPLTKAAFSWALRGGIAGLVIWISLWSLQGISALFQSPPPPPQVAEKPAFNPISALSLSNLDSGAWQFLDSSSSLSAQTLPISNAEASLLELPSTQLVTNHSLTDQSQDLLKLLKAHGKATRRADFNQYRLDQLGIRIVGFTQPGPPERLIALRWLIPLGEDKAWLIVQTSSNSSSPSPPVTESSSTSTVSTVIPAQILHRLLARRTDDSGKTFCQLIVAESPLPDLLDQLRRNSWKFDAPPNHLSSGFVTIYLTRRSDAFWMVVSPVADSTSLWILLLRDDNPSPPSAAQSSVEASP